MMVNEKLQQFKDSIASVTDVDALLDALQTERQTSIRINPCKMSNATLEPIPWNSVGYYLQNRPLFTLDPLFHCGAYYVQEASSMFIEQAIRPMLIRHLRVLDLCAAPGGKSTLLLSLLPEGSLLVANEVIRSRAAILSENIQKWGYENCIVTNNDPKDFASLRGFFDLILVDAPCSGEGMFRKDSQAIEEWSPENVDLCSKRQQRILCDIWDCLAPDGLLVYSTCTFNEKENEDVVSQFVSMHDAKCMEIPLQSSWNVTERRKNEAISYRFFPHKTKGEGFSLSAIRKQDGNQFSFSKKYTLPKSIQLISSKNYKDYISFTHVQNMIYYADNQGIIRGVPSTMFVSFQEIASRLNIIHAGISIAEMKGNSCAPFASLAFSRTYNEDAFYSVEVSLETAIHYFKKEPLMLSDAPKGWLHLTYNDSSIGFVKNIGNRANNSYPSEWSIKMNVDYGRLEKINLV